MATSSRACAQYAAYNLSVRSELALPELPALADASSAADVDIRLGAVAAHGLPGGKPLGRLSWARPGCVMLHVPDVARYLIEDGRSIVVEPAPGIDEDSVRVFLLGSALGALLMQRGHLVLHGNAVRIGDQCMVCVGASGAGKSTLAAGFLRRGHEVLADDVVPLDAQGCALPGFPRIKLWQDTADALAIDTTALQRIRPSMAKFHLPVRPASAPLPVRWVYWLNADDGDDVRVEPIHGMQRFEALRHNTYRLGFVDGLGLQAEHLRRCGQLAQRVHLARVARPMQRFALEPLLDKLLADLAAHP